MIIVRITIKITTTNPLNNPHKASKYQYNDAETNNKFPKMENCNYY